MGDSGLAAVVALLEQTILPDNAARNAAEAQLKAHVLHPTWPSGLLFVLTHAPPFPDHVRLAAALALKRATGQHWHYDEPSQGPAPYPEEVKAMGARTRRRAAPRSSAPPGFPPPLLTHPPPPTPTPTPPFQCAPTCSPPPACPPARPW